MTTLSLQQERTWISDITVSFLASVLIAIAAPISLKLPFTPVPLTLQVHLILFLAATLGSKRGAMMVLFYLMQGIMGFPVFAAGASGLATVLGPRGGYLMGYLVAAFVVGKLQEESREKSALKLFTHMGVGNLIVYLLGFAWLSGFLGMKGALMLGVLPFVIGDAIKLVVFSKLGVSNKLRRNGV